LLFFYELLGHSNTSSDSEFKLAPKELKRIDVMKVWEKYWAQMDASQPTLDPVISISSVPSWRDKSKVFTETYEDPEYHVDSVRIVKLHYHSKGHDADDGHLIIGCSNGFIIMDPRTYTTLHFADFQRTALPIEMNTTFEEDLELENPTASIPLADSFSFLPVQGISNTLLLLARNDFSRQYNLMTLVIPSSKVEESHKKDLSRLVEKGRHTQLDQLVASSVSSRVKGKWADGIYRECLNQLASVQIRCLDDLMNEKELPTGLPSYVAEDLDLLRKANCAKADEHQNAQILSLSVINEEKDAVFRKKIASKTLTKTPVKGKKGSSLDKPVTFRNRVKSSGYTLSPVATKMFSSPTGQKSAMKKGAAMPLKLKPLYPVDAGVPVAPHKKSFTIHHASGVLGLAYHSSGKFLATGSSDQMARSYKLPGGTAKDFIGHNGMVSDVSWSQDGHSYFGPLLLTSCTDGRARLWSSEKSEALLEFYTVNGSQKPSSISDGLGGATKASPKTEVFSSPIVGSRFFYKDSCIAVASGQSVYLYTYSLEKPDFGSIKPSPNRYRLLSSFSGQCQSLTAFTCATAFKSHLLFGATSDKSLCLWDAVTGQLCGRIKDAHSRWIHSLALADYETIPSAFSNVLITSAVSDGLKAWDIRTQKPIMSFLGHQNRSASVGCALSPCGRFIATGSEVSFIFHSAII
jgi:WD40 repeat protein